MLSLPGETEVNTYLESSEGEMEFTWANFNQSVVHRVGLQKAAFNEPERLFLSPNEQMPEAATRENYLNKIQHTIHTLQKNKWDKIVLSRAHHEAGSSEDAPELFRALAHKYPQACVYLFTHPQVGTWLGATPETLLHKQGDKLTTMSLAGTRSTAERRLFSDKEKQEQHLVTQFINQALQHTPGLHHITVAEPQLVQAGNVWHFRTMMEAKTDATFNMSRLLQKLHPTPAVAGVPRREALQFLAAHEGYQREFYSGYFGLRQNGEARYFVNLRCMQIFEQQRALYAGGGITVQSDAEREWQETEEKLLTLQSAWQHA